MRRISGRPSALAGQAPGRAEVAAGVPFIEPSGLRLAAWLELADVTVEQLRQDWYITSVSKCYPGRNTGSSTDRPPSQTDLARWVPVLHEEMRLLEPALLVLVGATAQRLAFGSRPLDELVGTFLTWPPVPQAAVICLPHPSGASRWLNEAAHVELWRDSLRLLRRQWRSLSVAAT